MINSPPTHFLPSSPMESLLLELDHLLLDSFQDFFNSCPMETDISFYNEFEVECNSNLVEWVATERKTKFTQKREASSRTASLDLAPPRIAALDPVHCAVTMSLASSILWILRGGVDLPLPYTSPLFLSRSS